jgi:hypothetical protein
MASFPWFSSASEGDYRREAGCEDFFNNLLPNAAQQIDSLR